MIITESYPTQLKTIFYIENKEYLGKIEWKITNKYKFLIDDKSYDLNMENLESFKELFNEMYKFSTNLPYATITMNGTSFTNKKRFEFDKENEIEKCLIDMKDVLLFQ